MHQNSEIIGLDGKLSRNTEISASKHKSSSRFSFSREKHAEGSQAPKLHPPWFKQVVSVAATSAMEDKMLRQETKASAPTPKPKNKKTVKAFSSTMSQHEMQACRDFWGLPGGPPSPPRRWPIC